MKTFKEEHSDFPPTYKLIIKFFFPKKHATVLDLGCGKGVAAKVLNSKRSHSFTGVDIFQPYINSSKQLGLYSNVIKKDITKFNAGDSSYDVVLMFQVVEHLEKKQSKKIIKNACRIAKQLIIITAPNGVCEQHAYDGNPFQAHHSEWSVNDFKRLGFAVYGQGLKNLYGRKSYGGGRVSTVWHKLAVIASLILSPIIFLEPELGAQLIAVKKKNAN